MSQPTAPWPRGSRAAPTTVAPDTSISSEDPAPTKQRSRPVTPSLPRRSSSPPSRGPLALAPRPPGCPSCAHLTPAQPGGRRTAVCSSPDPRALPRIQPQRGPSGDGQWVRSGGCPYAEVTLGPCGCDTQAPGGLPSPPWPIDGREAGALVCEVAASLTSQCPGGPWVYKRSRPGLARSPRSSTCSQVGWLNRGGAPALSPRSPVHPGHGTIHLLPRPMPEQTPPPETNMSQTEEALLPEAESLK